MKNISLNIDKALGTVTKEQVYAQAAKAHECNATLQNGNGAGNDFLGWLHLSLIHISGYIRTVKIRF